MNILLEEKLDHIDIDNLIKYLMDHNWTEFKTEKDGINIFQYEDKDNFYQVTIPLHKDFIDYYTTLYNTIKVICEKENIEEELLIRYLSTNHNPIYTITCMTRLETDELGWPNFGATAFMGFYHEWDDAIEAVIENWCDINETCYTYAVIEEILPGLYAYPRPRWFYKFNIDTKMYEPISEPEFMKHIANVMDADYLNDDDLVRRRDVINVIRDSRHWHFMDIVPILSEIKAIPRIKLRNKTGE